jgi:integrase
VRLGVAERGESAKTGTRQGCRPDRPAVAQILRQRKAGTQPGQCLFDLTAPVYRVQWDEAAHKLGWHPGPPHGLRHTGPSYDLLTAYRTLDQVRTRGRWRAKTSVLRYGKSHIYVAAEATLPTKLREDGALLYANFGVRPEVALQ